MPLHVRESHCLIDGRSLALFQTVHSDAPNQVRADFVWLKAVFAFLPAHAGPIASSSNGRHQKRAATMSTVRLAEASATSPSATRICQAGLLAIAEQLPTLGSESRETADERRESPAAQRWEGYR